VRQNLHVQKSSDLTFNHQVIWPSEYVSFDGVRCAMSRSQGLTKLRFECDIQAVQPKRYTNIVYVLLKFRKATCYVSHRDYMCLLICTEESKWNYFCYIWLFWKHRRIWNIWNQHKPMLGFILFYFRCQNVNCVIFDKFNCVTFDKFNVVINKPGG